MRTARHTVFMLGTPRLTILFAALAIGGSLVGCGSDASSTTSSGVAGSGGASGSSATGGGAGTGTAGSASGTGGAGGTSGSGGSASYDAAVDGPAVEAGQVDAAVDDVFISCAGPTDPVDFYQPNLTKLGKNGVLNFRLVESQVVLPNTGLGTWILQVIGPDGGQFSGDLGGHVTMPNHTHPVTVQPEPTFDPDKNAYVATPMYLYLSGYWRATFTAYAGPVDGGTAVDSVDFNFCVQ